MDAKRTEQPLRDSRQAPEQMGRHSPVLPQNEAKPERRGAMIA